MQSTRSAELGVFELNAVEGFELLAEVLVELGFVADVLAVSVLLLLEELDQVCFEVVLSNERRHESNDNACGCGGVGAWDMPSAINDRRFGKGESVGRIGRVGLMRGGGVGDRRSGTGDRAIGTGCWGRGESVVGGR